MPVLYASQSLSEILELTEQLIVLERGEVLRSGSLGEIARQSDVLRYLGLRQIDSILPVTLIRHDSVSGITLAQAKGMPLTLRLRPQLPVNSSCKVVHSGE